MGRSDAVDRVKAISRYLELRPMVRRRMEGSVPPQLREHFASMTPHQLRALLCLPPAGMSMKELAEAMNVTGATASVLADRLVSQGLACRSHDETDRRVVRLAPSEQGREVAEKARRAQRQMAKSLFDQLSDPQVEAFLDVMEAMAAPAAPAKAGAGR